jgi:ketosteroid isomerase-like protein
MTECRRQVHSCQALVEPGIDAQAVPLQAFETSCNNEDMSVATHGETAIANYRFVVKVTGPNVDVHRRYRTTNVWIKRDGRWQIIAAHTAFVIDAKQAAMLAGEAR